jgi:hypothetical protein
MRIFLVSGLGREIVLRFYEAKQHLSGAMNGHLDLLHLPFGLLIFLTLAILLRRRRASLMLAFLGVATLQILNEIMDALLFWIWMAEVSVFEAVADTIMTLILPGLVVLGAALIKRRYVFSQ